MKEAFATVWANTTKSILISSELFKPTVMNKNIAANHNYSPNFHYHKILVDREQIVVNYSVLP